MHWVLHPGMVSRLLDDATRLAESQIQCVAYPPAPLALPMSRCCDLTASSLQCRLAPDLQLHGPCDEQHHGAMLALQLHDGNSSMHARAPLLSLRRAAEKNP